MRWSVVAAVLLLPLGLAGCGGKDDGANQVRLGDGSRLSLDLPPEQVPAPDDIRGAVSGVVVDEAIFPVPGATVAVRDRDYAATADEDGRFAFEAMPPGLYTLEVRKDGHSDGLGTVNVRSGQVAKAVLMLPRLPVVEPYHTTWVFDEARTADRWATAYLWGPIGGEERLVAFDRPVETFVLESFWPELQSPFGDPLEYSIAGERDLENATSGRAQNPMLVRLDGDFFVRGEYAARLSVWPSVESVPTEVRGRVFATLFYVEPAPEAWSFVGGST